MDRYSFGDWLNDETGLLGLTPVILTEAQPVKGEETVIYRIAMIADRNHLELFKSGKVKPAVLQLSMPADKARAFASQLALAADLAEGRTPTPQG